MVERGNNMELQPNLTPPVKKTRPKKEVQPQQTLGEAWQKIFSMTTTSPTDRQRLREVQQAIEDGEIGVGVANMNKFSRSHALRLYTQLSQSRKVDTIQNMIDTKPSNYHLVTTIPQLEQLCKYLFNETELAVDSETSGLNFDVDHIVGISLTLQCVRPTITC
jgi:DNA polymerase-1